METKKNVRLVALFLVFLLAVATLGFVYEKTNQTSLKTEIATGAKSTMSFSPATINTEVDNNFTLEAKINPNGNQVTAVEVHISFPPDKIECSSITADSAKWNVLAPGAVNNSGGKASIIVGIAPGTSGFSTPTLVASLVCKAKTEGTASITFDSNTQAAATGETSNVILSTTPASVVASGTTVAPTCELLNFEPTSIKVGEKSNITWKFGGGYTTTTPTYLQCSLSNKTKVSIAGTPISGNYDTNTYSEAGSEVCKIYFNDSTTPACISNALTVNGVTPTPTPTATSTPTPSPTIVNGSCGSSNGGTFSSAPSSGLCSSGNNSSISGSGPWYWSCNGSNGGANASCSANKSASTTPVSQSPIVSVVPVVEYSYSYTSKVAPASGTATNVALILSVSAIITLGVWIAMKKIKG